MLYLSECKIDFDSLKNTYEFLIPKPEKLPLHQAPFISRVTLRT